MRLKPLILVSTLLCQGLASSGVAGPALVQSPADASGIGPGQQMENPARWYDDAVIYQYGGNRNQIILAEALNLLSPGTPVIYYGNEVGMTGQRGEDLDLRQPMDWAAVTTQTPQPDSILNWCKYLIKARGAYPALRGGYATLATDLGPAKALAYVRDSGAERVVVVANLTSAKETVTITDLTRHGVPFGGTVHAIIGGTGNNETLNGTRLAVTELPPYGIRVIYAAGGAFKGPIHGDGQ